MLGIGFLLAALAAGAAHYHPDSRAKLEEWGVYSTIDSIRTKLGIAQQTATPTLEEVTPVPPPAVASVIIESEPIAVQEVHHQADVPIEVVPKESPALTPQELVPVTVEATEIIPVEIVQIAQPDVAPIVEEAQAQQSSPSKEGTPETVLSELINELETTSPAPLAPSVDFQALLNAQAEQLEALKNKLQDYFQESSQAIDDRTKIHENAYHEALALRERLYRREVEEKLAQLQAQLKEQYEVERQADRNEAKAQMLQQVEQRRAELQREMEEALKVATDKAEAHYSVLLAEEINVLFIFLFSIFSNGLFPIFSFIIVY